MAITNRQSYETFIGVTFSPPFDAAIDSLTAAASAMIVRRIGYDPSDGSRQVTEVYDAPVDDKLVVRMKPLTGVGMILYAPNARGNPGELAMGTLLAPDLEYRILADRPDGSSVAGIIQRIGPLWGAEYDRRIGRLASRLSPQVGALQVTYTAGYSNPADYAQLTWAANQMVSWMRRTIQGGFKGSESWNGYSYSINAGNVYGALSAPGVAEALISFMPAGIY